MEKLGLNEIREKFLSYFESKGHLRLPSFPLIPQNDKSLLLINSGMAPMKPFFADKSLAPCTRVTTCQKCIRTPDIERVGKTARHGTYFEMLGNFSFGDYFKKEAIEFTWEFLTKVLKLPEDKLWPSVYEKDDDAYDLWKNNIRVPAERIVRLGKEDNFWEHGAGPCGPCSEMYYDRGAARGCGSPVCKPGCDCDRFVEIWNNVFSEFNNDGKGNYTKLAQQNIDTGMGLERLACVIQDVENLFEVDTIQRIMKHISEIAGVEYSAGEKTDISLRVITDHIRSTVFMVGDGVLPSNEGRGYVLRRLLRRAARHGRLLGIKEDFLYEVVETVVAENKSAYPELAQKKDYIIRVIRMEEERFRITIDSGLSKLEALTDDLKANSSKILSGGETFRLYDTYGFPIDLTEEILAEQGIAVDREGFDQCMKEQRIRARKATADKGDVAWAGNDAAIFGNEKTKFIGYTEYESKSEVLMMAVEGEAQSYAEAGKEAIILLDKTPFYGESGGQVGDVGMLVGNDGLVVEIVDTKKTREGLFLHAGRIISGKISIGDIVEAKIDILRRKAIMRAHSATHLLQRAIRDTVGTHAEQAGSFVEPDRLRFDFTHFEGLSTEELLRIEQQVNESILLAKTIVTKEMPIEEARKLGAMALFGEKYGDIVRVINMGEGYSVEFCGGTHLTNTAEAGLIKIISESSVAAGVRRIEAVTGREVINYLYEKNELIEHASAALKTVPSELAVRSAAVASELKEQNQKIEALELKLAKVKTDELIASAKETGGIKLIAVVVEGTGPELLRMMSDLIKDKCDDTAAVLASVGDGKIYFAASAGKTAVKRGIHSGNILKNISKLTGGGGGGRPDSATAGGKQIDKLTEAISSVETIVKDMLK